LVVLWGIAGAQRVAHARRIVVQNISARRREALGVVAGVGNVFVPGQRPAVGLFAPVQREIAPRILE
jgi:hypothetical protein